MAQPQPPLFMVADLLLSSVLLVTILCTNILGIPYGRGFYCSDVSIKYPYLEPAIHYIVVIVLLLGVPIIIFAIIEISTGKGSEPLFRNLRISNGVIRWFDVSSVFLFGAGVSQIVCDTCKYMLGRLRPHFLAVCKPTPDFDTLCPAGQPDAYITEYVCTGDVDLVLQARLSFPSGFSAFPFYVAVFTIMYLQYNFKWNTAKTIRHLLQFAVLMAAWYLALSRVADHHAHLGDMLFAVAEGAICAILTVLCMSDLAQKSKVKERKESLGLLGSAK